MPIYLRPAEVTDALAALAAAPLAILAGGTDFYPARVGRPLVDDVLDITALADLRGVRDEGDCYRIGALTTWTDLVRARLPSDFDALKLAAREVGGAQIQNAGTIAGNVCNASPAADGMPPLLALDASVELRAAAGSRLLAVGDFVTGNRATQRRPDELVTALLVPKRRRPVRSGFVKLGPRASNAISIVMAAANLEAAPGGTIGAARVAVGACSAVACRLPALEAALAGRPLGPGLGAAAAAAHLDGLAPIDDVRGTAAYRRDAALTVVRRLLDDLGARP